MAKRLFSFGSLLMGAALLMLLPTATAMARDGGGGGGGGGHGGGGFGGGAAHFGGGSSGGHFGGFSGGAAHVGGGNFSAGHFGGAPSAAHFGGTTAFRGGSFSGSHAGGAFVGAGSARGWEHGWNQGAWGNHAWDGHGWNGRGGWNGHGWWGHDHDFNDFHHGFFFGFPYFYGLYGLGGLGYYPYYDYYGYGYGYPYYDSYYPDYYAAYPSGYTSVNSVAPSVTYEEPTSTSADMSTSGEQFLSDARQAFLQGDYQNALRMANHAGIEMPRNPQTHELISLALFALKDYRGAAMEAHAALALGPPADWPTLYAYYQSVDKYTAQFRALEKFVRDNSKVPEGRFVLAYHDLMLGQKDAAKGQLKEAVALAPADKLADQILKSMSESAKAAEAPRPAAPPKAAETPGTAEQ